MLLVNFIIIFYYLIMAKTTFQYINLPWFRPPAVIRRHVFRLLIVIPKVHDESNRMGLFHQNRPCSVRDIQGGRNSPPPPVNVKSRNPTSDRVKSPARYRGFQISCWMQRCLKLLARYRGSHRARAVRGNRGSHRARAVWGNRGSHRVQAVRGNRGSHRARTVWGIADPRGVSELDRRLAASRKYRSSQSCMIYLFQTKLPHKFMPGLSRHHVILLHA